MNIDDLNSLPKPERLDDKTNSNQEWIELRHQLLGPEITEVERIKGRLDDPVVRATEISHILPDAITLSVVQDDRISRALQPAIDQSLKVSVTKNPQALADIISPVLGPGIRKAISATIAGMFQSLNMILNQSFSIRGLKWRIEAFKTRASFAEIVLFHTLVFKVEQIFLIHRSTGIVLQHVEAMDIVASEPDLVSGMLTAIQDFMNDSFQQESEDEIETLRMGKDRSIWVEQGPKAIIAAVIRGRPPLELRQQYRGMIDTIHKRYLRHLDEFDGEITPFAVTKDLLEDGLKQKVQEGENKAISPIFLIILTVIIVTVGIWTFTSYRQHSKFDDYFRKLKAEPGIVVLQTDKEKGRYVVSCLRDPLARDVELIARESGLEDSDIVHKLEPYYALHPALITARAQKWLTPPETVRLVTKNNTIIASGMAPTAWINHFCKRAMFVPGIENYDITELNNIDLEKMDEVIQDLSTIKIKFERGKSTIHKDSIELLKNAVEDIRVLQQIGRSLAIPVRVMVLGYADASGTEIMNKRISQERAKKVLQYLLRYNLSSDNLSAVGKGIHPKAVSADPMAPSGSYRIVMFNAIR